MVVVSTSKRTIVRLDNAGMVLDPDQSFALANTIPSTIMAASTEQIWTSISHRATRAFSGNCVDQAGNHCVRLVREDGMFLDCRVSEEIDRPCNSLFHRIESGDQTNPSLIRHRKKPGLSRTACWTVPTIAGACCWTIRLASGECLRVDTLLSNCNLGFVEFIASDGPACSSSCVAAAPEPEQRFSSSAAWLAAS
jgi:hypothetical protein